MYKTILVPLDGSKRAEAILPHVISLARQYGSTVIFLRIGEPALQLGRDEVVDFSAYQNVFEQQKNDAETYLKTKVQDFFQMGIKAEEHLMFGPVVKSILKVAEDCKADLIAMSSHGLGGIPRMFYGSVAAGLLQRVDRPLLIIRTRKTE